MRDFRLETVLLVAAACVAVASSPSAPPVARLAFSHRLPGLAAAHLQVSVVEVTYAAGGSSLPHTHPCPVVGYVLRGAIRTQVLGEPEVTYRAGEAFYEAPHGTHLVSANASQEGPATLLAFFVCEDELPLSAPLPQAEPRQGRTR